MGGQPMSVAISQRLRRAAQKIGTVNPMPTVQGLINEAFALPKGDPRYAQNALTPGAAPFEPSYSELQPHVLRFTVEPLGPEASGGDRRDEATREMRRLISPMFGQEALRWFDQRSEGWRGFGTGSRLKYGAFFGTSYDRDGLYSSKVYYEMLPHQIESLPPVLVGLVQTTLQLMPGLKPLFTTITCLRRAGSQRVTFLSRGALRLNDLSPLLAELGLDHQLPGIMQIIGLALGGRFELPEGSVLIALGMTEDGPEFEIYVLLGLVPDVPPNFLDLLTLGLTERPRGLQAMVRWLQAYTPESDDWPGNFSVLSVRTTARVSPRVSLYLRPIEFEVGRGALSNDGIGDRNGSDELAIPSNEAPTAA